MKKIAQSIVRLRKLILTVAVLLLIPCLLYTSDAADD